MICPSCGGEKRLVALVRRAKDHEGPPVANLPCYRCDGRGELPDEATAWIAHGKELKRRRLAADLTTRKAAAQLGILPSRLMFIEAGREPNLHVDWQYEESTGGVDA